MGLSGSGRSQGRGLRTTLTLFPTYATMRDVNANSASATLNKWLRPRLPEGCVIHSFRHSLRDRLRAAECPADIVDAIGGWTTQGVGHKYGAGYSLEVKLRWLKLIELQHPSMVKR